MRRRAVLAIVAMAGFGGATSAWGMVGLEGGRSMLLIGGAHRSHGYLGVATRDIGEDQMGILHMKVARGAEIVRVDHDGPGCAAGLREHDVILEVNGQTIEGEEQLRKILREIPPGRQVKILISREGNAQTMAAQMANREEVEREAWDRHWSVPDPATEGQKNTDGQKNADAGPARGGAGNGSGNGPGGAVRGGSDPAPRSSGLGFLHANRASGEFDGGGHGIPGTSLLKSKATGVMLEMISPQLAEYFGTANGTGLLVRNVDANGPAEAAGIKAGDVVIRINELPMLSTGDWAKAVRENRGRQVAVTLMREKHEQTLTMTLDGKRRSCLEAPNFFSLSRPAAPAMGPGMML